MREVGAEIRRLREQRGWTGAQLAVYAGMAPSAVSQIETGRRNPNTGSLAKIAKALDVEVVDLFPKAQAPRPLDEELIVSRAEIREWLHDRGHKSEEEFLEWARALGADTDDEEEVLQAIDDGVQELILKRSEILRALRKPDARKLLFPIPPGLSKTEIRDWLLKPPGRRELENEIRREYSSRVVALMNYSTQLFAEGKSSGYISHRHDRERHERLLEHRRKVLEERRRILEESYAEAVA